MGVLDTKSQAVRQAEAKYMRAHEAAADVLEKLYRAGATVELKDDRLTVYLLDVEGKVRAWTFKNPSL